MDLKEYTAIGRLVATFGFKGDVVLKHHLGKKTSLKGIEAIYVEEAQDRLLPYFIEDRKIKSESELLLKLEGINSREAARKVVQRKVWLPEDQFRKHASQSAAISLLGFHIIDGGEDLGEILEVIEQPHQILCRILRHQKEIFIPLHEKSLVKIDKKNKKVIVELPDGLLEVFE